MYPESMTKPMEAELTENGFKALKDPKEVANILSENEGSTLLVINSVCGCAASNARPAVIASLESAKKPSKLITVFAGVDYEAVAKAREFTFPYPPSSPSIGLFNNGKLVAFFERHSIEGHPVREVADRLVAAYETYL